MSGSASRRPAASGPLSVVSGWMVAMIAASALAGCSDTMAPSETTFRKAVEPLVRDRFCRLLDGVDRLQVGAATDVPAWPLIVPARPITGARHSNELARTLLDGAAGDGMLERRAETLRVRRIDHDEEPASRQVIVYRPMSKGAAIFRPIEAPTPSGMRLFPGVCAAGAEVTQIVRWTEPVDAFGATTSQVTYRYRATDLTPLVPESEREGLTAPKEATVTLVRASDGWRPVDLR